MATLQMVVPDLTWTKKVTADKGGAGPPLPRIVMERTTEAPPRRFCALSVASSLAVTQEAALATSDQTTQQRMS